ncbi:cation diffusion facilitator family transporter [Fictibacillus solisalsi]|uniref:Cation diffusion facilitator family transporter n=1 Tax=Fictibacillus solisalsi TaxID=459525 RepID=A0A1G9TJ46_9BACL|nr:cation diffusion facilitator family transporter [Fictibacillus solisalsi]SDM47741.1 cation diffusion facilitator family transporter [Fictibacillus solisalsi]
MGRLFKLLKNGNKSAFLAAIVNTIIAIIKGGTYIYTGNVAMFAETMHSLGDAANQFFVFIGSALSKRGATNRFPNGFGRLVHLVLLGAVIIVGIMSFETIKEGFSHIFHPTESTGFLINIAVLAAAVVLEGFVLFKAMREIMHDVGDTTSGFAVFFKSFGHLPKAKPATKLVFMEDLVATAGGVLAIVAIVISHFTPFHQAEGIASIIIGLMMFFVVGKVFLDNAAGVLGEADEEMEDKIGELALRDPEVKDVVEVVVIKEGEELHVELEVEVDPLLTVAQADDIKDRLEEKILQEKGVTDVTIEFDEDDGIQRWEKQSHPEKLEE